MPTAEKERSIEQAREWYSKSVGVVFTDYRGLSVKDLQNIRNDLRKKGGELRVVKNTLFRIAAGKDIELFPAELHNGTTAIAFVYENESGCAKALVDFARTSRKMTVKGGYFSGQVLDTKQVEALASLPPREVLLAQLIGVIAAPISNLIGTIEALYADPIRTIGAVADKMGGDSPAAPEAKAEPAAAPAPPAEAPAAEAASEPAEAAPEAAEAAAEPDAAGEPAAEEPISTEAEASNENTTETES